MAKTKKKTQPPKVSCDLCHAKGGERCETGSGTKLSRPHAVRLEAERTAKQDGKLNDLRKKFQGPLPCQYRIGPTPLIITTDLFHLGIHSPDLVTEAREREQKVRDGHVELTYLTYVEVNDGRFVVTVKLDGASTALPDKVARSIRQDMDLLESLAEADRQETRRAEVAAKRRAELDRRPARRRLPVRQRRPRAQRLPDIIRRLLRREVIRFHAHRANGNDEIEVCHDDGITARGRIGQPLQ